MKLALFYGPHLHQVMKDFSILSLQDYVKKYLNNTVIMINKILALFELTDLTPEQYSKTIKDLEAAGQAHPRGRLYHVAVVKNNRISFTDIWESEETLFDFTKILFPILINNAVTPVNPEIQNIYNIISF